MSTPITEKGCYYNHVNALAENTLRELQSPEVRDLAWACFSPSLFKASLLDQRRRAENCRFPLTDERRDWLRQLDRQPEALQQHLAARKSTRLGIYFESLWQFFLRSDSQVELLASNLPVQSGGKTLGEFDLLYFCRKRQRPVHLELALKFYLCAPDMDGSQWQHWLGPDSSDRLDLKLRKMLDRQIRLSEQAQARATLAALQASSPLREVEIKGRLYRWHPASALAPPAYNRQLAFHQWVHAARAARILDAVPNRRLQRRQWLAPLPANTDTSRQAPVQELADRAQQFAVLDNEGRERYRLFVVPDHWPRRHA